MLLYTNGSIQTLGKKRESVDNFYMQEYNKVEF